MNDEKMKVYIKDNGKWSLIFCGSNWKKGWEIADKYSAEGYEVKVE